ncbi:hypothetical protein SLEP1_g8564 [Rubroshorea leprosula]|uniref:Uncharacterized protein n=1 Tax=Rubroshorea leprosula TaxID=152421 RepID=A0AAV5I218_9ROSI|nr:hypothetical protein SLEP1_g8564 [Rubroshorea leprosula]
MNKSLICIPSDSLCQLSFWLLADHYRMENSMKIM